MLVYRLALSVLSIKTSLLSRGPGQTLLVYRLALSVFRFGLGSLAVKMNGFTLRKQLCQFGFTSGLNRDQHLQESFCTSRNKLFP